MRCCDEESPPLDLNVDGANAKENVDVHVDHSYASKPLSAECQDKPSLGIQDKIVFLENKIKELELKLAKKKAMSVSDIKDDKETFFLYTGLSYDIFCYFTINWLFKDLTFSIILDGLYRAYI